MILAGDVGGTKVHLALFDFTEGKLTHYPRQTVPGARVRRAWKRSCANSWAPTRPARPALACPARCAKAVCALPICPGRWTAASWPTHLGIDYVFLINDLEANGYGIAELDAKQIYTLSEGDASQMGNRALISAGTGLGEGFLVWNGRSTRPTPPRAATATLPRATRTRSTCCASCSRSTTGASALSAWSAARGSPTATSFCARCAAWKSRRGWRSAWPRKTRTP